MTKSEVTSLYRHFDAKGTLLYVGISLNTVNRLCQHKTSSPWINDISLIKIEQFNTREEAIEAEKTAIQNECPLHNINGKLQPQSIEDEINSGPEKSKQLLLNTIVSFNPMYTIEEASHALRVSPPTIRKLINDKLLGCIVRSRPFNKSFNKPRVRVLISGWQLIDYIEYAEKKGELYDSNITTEAGNEAGPFDREGVGDSV